MTILWLTPEKPDNISIGRQRIAEGLRERGYTVDQRSWSPSDSIRSLNGSYDLHIATTHAGAVVGLPTTLTSTPYIVDHVDPLWKLATTKGATVTAGLAYAESVLFDRADGVIHVYDGVAIPESVPTVQTSMGVDYERFQDPPKDNQRIIRDWLAIEGVDEDFAIYIGGFEERYNLDTLLAAAREFRLPIVLAGDGSQRDIVEHAADTAETITYLGTVEHELVPALLDHASLGVCLVNDAHTVKVLEYGAAGLPVVHRDGRARGVLPDRGVIWAENTIQSVTQAINRGLETPPETSGLESYAKQRTWTSVVDDYERVIQNV